MRFLNRIYADYLMPGRWEDYRALLSTAKAANYEFLRHQDALAALKAGKTRLFFLRHDVDTDVPLARKLFDIEREFGVVSTYYFRRCTADYTLMREIHALGSEVGYHYEELSDYAKRHGIKDKATMVAHLEPVRAEFLANLRTFEAGLGAKVVTVAGHGDFVNRSLHMSNPELLNDELRKVAGIEMEAYDEALVGGLDFRTADRPYPDLYQRSPLEAIRNQAPVILILIHPRNWASAPLRRLGTDLGRMLESTLYMLK